MPVPTTSPSNVSFPASEPLTYATPPKPSSYLPFRRISIPTTPSPHLHRRSGVSVTSVDLTGEDGAVAIPKNKNLLKKKSGSITADNGGKRSRKKDVRKPPVDEAREAKRRKVVLEFFETERAYVDGLDLIYSHFLTPVIESLNTPTPLLTRTEMTTIFSNFIDIWNLHRSFFSLLSDLLTPEARNNPPPLSPILLSHFPYLSLYTPFISSFPTSLNVLTTMLSQPASSSRFAAFVQRQQLDQRCMKLTIRDWLLTIVQRCPRYLLLLKDLIGCTTEDDPEYTKLNDVYTLVSKITLSLNTSLATHTRTLSLLSLQRRTTNLPPSLQFVVPGRMLEKRGEVIMVSSEAGGRGRGRRREMLLFSDCLVWLERVGTVDCDVVIAAKRPPITRTRSKSEAELSKSSPTKVGGVARHSVVRADSTGDESAERWEYKGSAHLVDLEVVIPTHVEGADAEEEQKRLEVLNPEGSFVLYAASTEDRDEWKKAIREAKSTLLVSLTLTHPNSTLTSSVSTNHLRRSLQALPFEPSDERLGTIREVYGWKKVDRSKKAKNNLERRAHVGHWVPANWIPDAKVDACMRCGRSFGWRRRRHHCRLCGRCVCSSCSARTFYVAEPMAKDGKMVAKAARACDECYETVFPLLHPLGELEETETQREEDGLSPEQEQNATPSLSGLPSWFTLSTPTPAAALMAMTRKNGYVALALASEFREADVGREGEEQLGISESIRELSENSSIDGNGRKVVKAKELSRPRSYYEILEDFHNLQEEWDNRNEGEDEECVMAAATESVVELPSEAVREREKENTERRLRRFSSPALALQTTSVLAQTSSSSPYSPDSPIAYGIGRERGRRLSLVPASGKGAVTRGVDVSSGKKDLGKGMAAGKLHEVLGRQVSKGH